MKNIVYVICILIPSIFILAFNQVDEKDTSGPPRVKAKKEATVLRLERQKYESYLTAYGEIQNDNQIKLSFEMSGKLKRLNVEEGQYVRKGQILMALDNTQQANNTQQLTNEKEKVKYALNSLYLEKDNAIKNLKSVESLFADGVATQEEEENARLQLDLINNKISAQEESLKLIGSKLEVSNFNTDLFVLKAPQNGTIGKVFVKKNEGIGAGQEVIHFSPVGQSAVVELNMTAREIAQVEKGFVAKIHVDYPQEKTYTGKVRSISYYRDQGQGDYSVIIDMASVEDKLIYGDLVKVDILTKVQNEGYKIPFDAIDAVKEDRVELLTISPDSIAQRLRFSYQKINNEYLLINDENHETLDIIIDKSIGLKPLDKVEHITYKKSS